MRALLIVMFFAFTVHYAFAQQPALQNAYTTALGTVQTRGIAEGPQGYFLCGFVIPPSDFDASVIHLDFAGDTLWTFRFNASSQDIFNSVCANSDSGCTVTGHSLIGNVLNLLTVRLDKNGNILWSNYYSENGFSVNGIRIRQTYDGGFVAVGEVFGPGYYTGIIKLDANGSLQWSNKFYQGSLAVSKPLNVLQLPDSSYSILSSYYTANNLTDIRHIRIDPNGNVIWEKTYGWDYADYTIGIIATPQGGFIIAAWYPYAIANQVGVGTAFIFTDSNGIITNMRWFLHPADDIRFIDLFQDAQGNLVLAGMVYPAPPGYGSAVCATFSNTALFQSGYYYGTADAEEIFAAGPNQAGGTLLAGDLLTGIPNSFYLIRTDTNYQAGCNETPFSLQNYPATMDTTTITTSTAFNLAVTPVILNRLPLQLVITDICQPSATEEFAEISSVNVYPNPATNTCTVTHDLANETSTLAIYNSIGELIFSIGLSGTETTMDVTNFAAGMYCITVQTNNVITTCKLLVQ